MRLLALALSIAFAAPALADYAKNAQADLPGAYYRFAETDATGVLVDSSGNVRQGQYQGSPAVSQAGAIKNDPNAAVLFNGSNEYVDSIADSNFWSPATTGDFTALCWFKLTAGVATIQQVMSKGSPYEFQVRFNGSSLVPRYTMFTAAGATYHDVGAGTGNECAAGAWCFFAFTHDDGVIGRAYFNGVETNTNSSYSGTQTGNQATPVNIARRQNNDNFLNGTLDECEVYGSILSPARIESRWKYGTQAIRRRR